ncbi:ABC transporter permease subunit [Pontibacillus sp. HMF3514]|uniref:ABC transporter permease subunit n=1 Tax=Pontibacillus sp. HMF3514 TaxID=2692425 RepID=UPI00131F5AF7|nr:ABC transporter permease subunit [Pontibacillus sp. HMF3514]QHE51252.1 ABC transporter permease subunit [Pontibacillus sp. HMF3514]
MKKMGLREFLFILPILILIGIFSLWPVVQSFTYSFFDYQLNDRTKSGLYLSERFNPDLYHETAFYVDRLLTQDMEKFSEENKQEVKETLKQINEIDKQFEGQKEVTKIDGDTTKKIETAYEQTKKLVKDLKDQYKLTDPKNLPLLVEDINNSLVQSNFIGFNGYVKALKDDRIHTATINTFIFTIISVFFELILGLGMALIMNKAMKGQGFIRTASLIPWAIPTAVGALMWSYLYDGGYGIVALIFSKIGLIGAPTDLLQTGTGAMSAAILADVWKTTPYMAILLLAGLQTIPKSLYEAGAIDGATKIQQFFRVTLPLLKSSILVALLFRTLDAFRVFDLIYVLTGGGPGGATETLSMYSYKVMFGQTDFGYGSVIVIIMFVFVAIISIIFVRVLGTDLMEKN